MNHFDLTDRERLDLAAAAAWLATAERLLITTHVRPDGDAVGSVLSLRGLLTDLGCHCAVFFPEEPGGAHRRVLPVEHVTADIADVHAYDALCVLDCGNPERVALPAGITLKAFTRVLNLDHHPDNQRYGTINAVVSATSTTEALLWMARMADWPLSRETATALMFGLVTDCGTFRFGNTTARTFRSAAMLLEAGARYPDIVDALHFRVSAGCQRLRNILWRRATFAFDGKLAWTVLEKGDLEACGVHPQETENIIDVIRCLDTVEVACLLQPEKDAVRFSLRSRSSAISAGRIARRLGGGGHAAAAGASVDHITVEGAVQRLLPLVAAELDLPVSST
ncbi:MAG: DHHA1 domain-containing protein [Lentisphaeria bacterium]|nr:DHHA1 domain-containing protein [Lentisphaeria bacterium]